MSRLIFFGSPDFALPTLERLCAAGRRPEIVVSQPARPTGRGHRLQDPPVARWAREQELEVRQPSRVSEEDFLQEMLSVEPSVAVVVAFGQIFSKELLGLPTLGCINLHASLLPAYRGAAPIQAAIMAGETVTGVSTMRMEQGLDSGPVLLQEAMTIEEFETAGELSIRLARLGADLVVETLDRLERGEIIARPQDSSRVTMARRLKKSDGRVDWRVGAETLFNRLRGLTPWPGLTARLRGEALKIVWAVPGSVHVSCQQAPGSILGLVGSRLAVCCGDGKTLEVEQLQRPGKKPVGARDFYNGERLAPGERFDV